MPDGQSPTPIFCEFKGMPFFALFLVKSRIYLFIFAAHPLLHEHCALMFAVKLDNPLVQWES